MTKLITNSDPLFLETPLKAIPNSESVKNGIKLGTSLTTSKEDVSTTLTVCVPLNHKKHPSSSVWCGFLK